MDRSFKTTNPMGGPRYDQCRHCCIEQMSNAIMFYGNVKEAHWNVKGVDSLGMHRYFDELAAILLEHVDELGERVVALGGYAFINPSVTDIANPSRKATTAKEWTVEIADGLGAYIKMLHGHIAMTGEKEDMISQDIFISHSRELEKQLMFLEMHLQD